MFCEDRFLVNPRTAASGFGRDVKSAMQVLDEALATRSVPEFALAGNGSIKPNLFAYEMESAGQRPFLYEYEAGDGLAKATHTSTMSATGSETTTFACPAVIQANQIAAAHYEAFIPSLNPALVNIERFREMFDFLKHIPGSFKNTATALGNKENGALARILRCGSSLEGQELSTVRGALYEAETAYRIGKYEEEVVELGTKLGNYDFDVVTKTRLIECKNIKWPEYVSERSNGMQSTFGSQLRLAKEQQKIFEVHSKQPVPDDWKQWFISKGIKVVEG